MLIKGFANILYRMIRNVFRCICLGAVFSANTLIATTIYVSQCGSNVPPFGTWQDAANSIHDALASAPPGAIVVVSNGTYLSSAPVTIDKPVLLQSVGGAENTVIDAQFAGRCFFLTATNAVVDGFTVRRGRVAQSGQHGGGFLIQGSGNIVRNCWITECASDSGAGAYVNEGNVVEYCRVFGNSTLWNHGGGVYLNGGVLKCSTVLSNWTSPPCGPGGFGGGICIDHGLALNCVVYANSAYAGGGIWMMSPHYGLNESVAINCTVVGNTAVVEGDGVSIWGGSISNCIIYYNSGTGTNISRFGGYNVVSYCCVPEGGDAGTLTNSPELVAPMLGDLHLRADSPCIDAGINIPLVCEGLDLDGQPRCRDGKVDMGAYEAAIRAGSLSVSNGNCLTTWSIVPGGLYQLEYKTNFLDGWHACGSAVNPAASRIALADTNADQRTRFYRLVWLRPK
jgi:hypothetical protein